MRLGEALELFVLHASVFLHKKKKKKIQAEAGGYL